MGIHTQQGMAKNMCGRFTLKAAAMNLQELFHLQEVPPLPMRYNIAPTQMVAAVRLGAERATRELALLRWGLVPPGASDLKVGNRLINARAETAAQLPAFRSAFRHRRCLVLADGFYEWKEVDGKKQPYYFQLRDGGPFAFAGLWDSWNSPEGEAVESCTVLTTRANELVAPVHDRMPVILLPQHYDLWLDTTVQQKERLAPLLTPYPPTQMQSHPVGQRVNSAQNDEPECIEPVAELLLRSKSLYD